MTCYTLYFFIFICLFLEVKSFTPAARLSHSSVLADNKLYFFGGVTGVKGTNCSNEVFYLDVSQSFDIQTPPWNDLTPNAGIPFKSSWAATSLSNANNEKTIYLFGGITLDLVTNRFTPASVINSFNLNSLKWNVPAAKGIPPERRRQMSSVIDDTGKMYIFSGGADTFLNSPTLKLFNDMVIFNTVETSWLVLNPPNAPPPLIGYSATLLSNGNIIYIGGYQGVGNTFTIIDISQIYIFNTKSLAWSNQVSKFIDPIDNRSEHTTVLAPNGKIIVYGGSTSPFDSTKPTQVLAVLNTEVEPFEWTAPLVSSNVVAPSLIYHTADLVDNYMIVAFGNITQPNGPPIQNSKIYLLDIRNFTWVYSFEPSTPPNNSNNSTSDPLPTYTQPSASNELTMKIVTATLSAIFGTMFIMAIIFFGYRWYKKRQSEDESEPDGVLRIYGNQSNTY